MAKRPRDLSELDTVFLQCRTVGHAWEPIGLFIDRHGRRQVWSASWVCDRERRARIRRPTQRDDITATGGRDVGRLLGVRYHYADGYLLAPGTKIGRGRARPAARIEFIGRLEEVMPKT